MNINKKIHPYFRHALLLLIAFNLEPKAELVIRVTGVPNSGTTEWTFSGDSMTWNLFNNEVEESKVFRSTSSILQKENGDTITIVPPIPIGGPIVGANIFNFEATDPLSISETVGLVIDENSDAKVLLCPNGWVPLREIWLTNEDQNGVKGDKIGFRTDQDLTYYESVPFVWQGTAIVNCDITKFVLDQEFDAYNVFFGLRGDFSISFHAIQPKQIASTLLVADRGSSSILKFDAWTGESLGVFANIDEIGSPLLRPRDVKKHPNETLILVTDSLSKRVLAFDELGNCQGTYGDASFNRMEQINSGIGFYPWSMEFDSTGNLYVTQRLPKTTGQIIKFSPEGNYLGNFNMGVMDEFGGMAIAINSDDHLFVSSGQINGQQSIYAADNTGSAIFFDTTGNPIFEFGQATTNWFPLQILDGDLTFDANGYFFVNGIIGSISQSGSVYKFSPSGELLGRVEGAGNFDLSGQKMDLGLSFDPYGRLLVSESKYARIAVFDNNLKFDRHIYHLLPDETIDSDFEPAGFDFILE